MNRRGCWMAGSVLVLVSSSAALAQNAGGAGEPVKTLLVVDRVELSKVLVDPKDQKLGAALGMLPARLKELPGEVPNMPPQASQLIDLILHAVARPAKVAVTYGAGNPGHGMFGYGLVVSVEAKDAADAKDMQASVNALLAAAPIPEQFSPKESQRVKGMADIALPFALLSYGPRESATGWRYEIILGTLDNPDAAFATLPKPMGGGVSPIVRGRLDLEQPTPAAQFAMTMAGGKNPEIKEVFSQLTKMGLIGPQALKIDFEDGYTASEHLGRVVVHGAKAHMDQYWMTATPLSKSELSLVPANATVATITKTQLSKLSDMLTEMSAKVPQINEVLEKFKTETGVDLKTDILASLGETVAVYMSDATGGGSIASAVGVIGLKDPAKFLTAHDKLLAKANEFFMHMPKGGGYVKISPWEQGGVKLYSLRFGGIPVPLELTYGVVGNWLVTALTPQGALAAAQQVMGKGDGGLTKSESFAATLGNREVNGLTFIDTARMMHAGYPIVSMIGSAVSNGVRSRDGSREPGLVVPGYMELAAGARPHVQLMGWNGDDYLIETHGDRSVLVRASGAVGTAVQFWPLIAAAVGGAQAAEHHHGGMSWNPGWPVPAWASLGDHLPVTMADAWLPRLNDEQADRWMQGRWVEDAVTMVK